MVCIEARYNLCVTVYSYILPWFTLCYMDWLAPTPCRNTTYSIYQISLQDCLNIETSWEFSFSTVLWSMKSRAVYHLLIPLRPNQFFSSAPWSGTTFDEGFHLKAGALSNNIEHSQDFWFLIEISKYFVGKEGDGGFLTHPLIWWWCYVLTRQWARSSIHFNWYITIHKTIQSPDRWLVSKSREFRSSTKEDHKNRKIQTCI